MVSEAEARSLGCARCGDCCENIYLGIEMKLLVAWSTATLAGVPDPRIDEGWAYWTSEDRRGVDINGRETFPYQDGDRARILGWYDPEGDRRLNADFLSEHWHEAGRDETGDPFYSCDQFNAETRLCNARDGRPPVCSGYPWYGRDPNPELIRKTGSRCSYLLDLPPTSRPEGARPLIPVEVLRG